MPNCQTCGDTGEVLRLSYNPAEPDTWERCPICETEHTERVQLARSADEDLPNHPTNWGRLEPSPTEQEQRDDAPPHMPRPPRGIYRVRRRS